MTLVAFYGRIRLIDTASAKIIYDFKAHTRWINVVRIGITPESNQVRILTGGGRTDNSVNVFNFRRNDTSSRLFWCNRLTHRSGISDIAISPNRSMFAAAGGDRKVYVYTFEKCEKLHALRSHLALRSLDFSPCGKYILSSSRHVQLWDVITPADLMSLFSHPSVVLVVKFAYERSDMFASCSSKTLQVHQI